jgi:hypothetical protein
LSRGAFFQGQVEQPVRGLTSLITHQDMPVLVAINAQGVYVIDDIQCVSQFCLEDIITMLYIVLITSKQNLQNFLCVNHLNNGKNVYWYSFLELVPVES